MKIFVAFGYNERDRWVRELVFPIIEAFGGSVVTGEDMQGDPISEEVMARIRSSNGLIAFVTRRDAIGNGKWTTHRWVTDELSSAVASRVRAVEVRELGVEPQGGIAGDRQLIVYDEQARDRCLVELVKTLGRWSEGISVDLQLFPLDIVRELRPLIPRPGFRCTYKTVQGHMESEALATAVRPTPVGLMIHCPGLSVDALVQVHIEAAGRAWTSDFVGIRSLGVTLQPD